MNGERNDVGFKNDKRDENPSSERGGEEKWRRMWENTEQKGKDSKEVKKYSTVA